MTWVWECQGLGTSNLERVSVIVIFEKENIASQVNLPRKWRGFRNGLSWQAKGRSWLTFISDEGLAIRTEVASVWTLYHTGCEFQVSRRPHLVKE